MKINDNKIWQGIKNGEFNGFSIESLVQLKTLIYRKLKIIILIKIQKWQKKTSTWNRLK